jgi:glucose/arabinose dehydrogenase
MLKNRRLLALGAVTALAALTAVIIAVLALAPKSNDSQAGELVQGDADCSQTVDARDSLADLALSARIDSEANCVVQAGDVDCDDEIDSADAAAILRYSAVGQQEDNSSGNCAPIGTVIATRTPTSTPPRTPTPTHTSTPTPTPTATATASGGASGSATPTAHPSGSQPPVTTAPATGTPGPCAGPGGGASLPPAPGSGGTPQSGAYDVQEVLSQDDLGDAADSAIEFALIPGRPNEAIVADQSGYIYRVALDQSFAPQPWGDVHSLVEFSGEQGLLSVAFSPNFQNDCRVYLYYTKGSPQPSVLARFRATPSGLIEDSEEPLLTIEQPYTNHNGGHIVFGKDGYLYIGFGDGGSAGDPGNRAQNMGTLLGKMVRIDVSPQFGYTVPSDNPFVDGPGGNRDEIYALGFRNPFRFTSDPVSGDIWIGDVGQNNYEEVDRLVKGGNYGWDCREGFHEYSSNSDPVCDNPPSFIEPRAEYDHSGGNQAVTGGVIYRGDDMPELYGWYVHADFYSGRIWAVNPNDSSGAVQIAQPSLNISAFTLAADGEMYLVSYSNGIYRLTR